MIYIQSTEKGIPINQNMYIAQDGFHQMGFEIVPFYRFSELDCSEKEDIIVGGVQASRYIFDKMNLKIPYLNYPKELRTFLGRRVWNDVVENIMYTEIEEPIFVKPVREKIFTGFVYESKSDNIKFTNCEKLEKVLCSEVIDIKREWRVFVRYGKIIDVRPYYGDWREQYECKVIDKCVSAYNKGTAPASYVLDFGVINEGKTVLIEVNDGYSVGCYGLQGIDYAKFLSARWSEIKGIKDECDFEYESIKWFNRKG